MSNIPRGLILGIDTILASRKPEIIRAKEVIVDPTDERINAIAIKPKTIAQSIIATLDIAATSKFVDFDTETQKALQKALVDNRVLDGVRWKKSASDFPSAVCLFLEKHGFQVPQEVAYFFTNLFLRNYYLTYQDIAQMLHKANIPVYFISNNKGPSFHYTWETF